MSNIFVISDTWFNRLIEDDPNENVVDRNEQIIQVWNSAIEKNDIVYVLGGFGISDLYHIVIRLNGKIHFLNNCFNADEKEFIKNMKESIDMSTDSTIRDRIIFDNNQIAVLSNLDSILSYFPLEDWGGKSTGTYCFHGLNEKTNLLEHNISCVAKKWEYIPVNIIDVQKNISECVDIIE